MKKIINGKMYNTETAKAIGWYENGYYPNDFRYFKEVLYQKQNGEYFLYGVGNAASKYQAPCGSNNWSGSEVIKPFTKEEAMAWAEKNLIAEQYIEAFGEPEE